MITSHDIDVPERALVIVAHPDDAEFQAGATLAKWARLGTEVHHLVLTDGSKGTWDPNADPVQLIETRKQEQQAAASALGATGSVNFLGLVDGELKVDRDSIARTSLIIRQVRPDIIVGHDPWKRYRLHPDHRRAGELCIEAIIAARDPLFYPEQLVGELEPHRPSALLLFEPDEANHAEAVTEADHRRRLAALESFESQFTTTHLYRIDEIEPEGLDRRGELERFRSAELKNLQDAGKVVGVELAELFHLIVDQL